MYTACSPRKNRDSVCLRFFFSSRRRHTRCSRDWSSDVCSSDLLSYSAWRSRFGADPAIVGKTIRLNRLPYTVLGVAPPDFHGTELFYWPEVWVPMIDRKSVV